jgi:hypothetical protein
MSRPENNLARRALNDQNLSLADHGFARFQRLIHFYFTGCIQLAAGPCCG